jgi:ankyrin repeat protein
MDYFAELPPELISLLSTALPAGSLNALSLTCHRLHEILQPELDARITPELGKDLLVWAAESKRQIVAKLLAPPHLIKPNEGYEWWEKTPLHVAVDAKNTEIIELLLNAGADPLVAWDDDGHHPLHLAVENNDLSSVRLLLDHGADIDAKYGDDGLRESALHDSCCRGRFDMVSLLLERGANMEVYGHDGTALGFALHACQMDVIRLLLQKGANVEAPVPLFGTCLCGGPPEPHVVNPLYLALGLRHPRSEYSPGPAPEEGRKERIALLLAHGASRNATMKIIFQYLKPLAEAADKTEKKFLELVETRFKEAEVIIGDVSTPRQVWAYQAKAGIRMSGRALRFVARLWKGNRVVAEGEEGD